MRAVWTLVLACVLFGGWLGYLAFLAKTVSNPVVLSRPQFLVATLVIKAHIDDPKSKQAVVKEVYWTRDAIRPPAAGSTITVANLDQCKDPHFAWHGAGEYILPLQQTKQGVYAVAEVPPSPGFPTVGGEGTARIYRDTAQTREQLERLKPPD